MNNHRNNRLRLRAGMVLIVILLLMATACIPFGSGPVPVDVVMVDNELFFVLEEEYDIQSIWVIARNPNTSERENLWESEYTMWALAHDKTTKVETRKYPRLKQIKYGQKFEEFPLVIEPHELQRNVEYSVQMYMGRLFAGERFIITSDNKVIMPHPKFVRQKNRTYSVSIDKDGNKILVPQPISNGEVK